MNTKVARPSFDWCNYFAALLSAALVGAVAGAGAFALAVPFMNAAPIVPSEMTLLAMLAFLVKTAGLMVLLFFSLLAPSGVIAFVATLVFGSITLLLVRRTKLYSVATFALAGFVMGIILPIFAFATERFSVGYAIALVPYGLAGLAGGWAFGYRICFPVAMSCGPRLMPAGETRLSHIVRALLAR